MNKPNHDDIGDEFDDDSLADDDKPAIERIHKRRDPRGPTKPKDPRDGGSGRFPDKHDRRRELASRNAWGAPY